MAQATAGEPAPDQDGSAPDTDPTPTRLTGADALRLHLTLAAGLALCVGAFIFELIRALGGHSFSWLYVFEWPLFAGFAIYMWWNLLNGHDRQPRPPAARRGTVGRPAGDSPAGGDLEAWQRYLRDRERAERREQEEST